MNSSLFIVSLSNEFAVITNMMNPVEFNENFYKLLSKYQPICRPDFQKFSNNLHNTHWDNRIYLGTYFPRTVAEVYSIFNNAFGTHAFDFLMLQGSIKILSFGCGLGGDIFGLVVALCQLCDELKCSLPSLEIVAIDGNQPSLETMEDILGDYFASENVDAKITSVHHISTKDNFCPDSCFKDRYDFILTSKALNELYSQGNYGAYKQFCTTFLPLLNIKGVTLISDITCKLSDGRYAAQCLNYGVTRSLSECPEFTTLLPLGCNRCSYCSEFTKTILNCFADLLWQKEYETKIHFRFLGRRKAYPLLEAVASHNHFQKSCCSASAEKSYEFPLALMG